MSSVFVFVFVFAVLEQQENGGNDVDGIFKL